MKITNAMLQAPDKLSSPAILQTAIRMKAAPLRIRHMRLEGQGVPSRLTVDVDGCPVWYESTDVPLQARAEGMASAFLLPAMKAGRELQIEGASISPRWLDHARALMAQFSAWWGYLPVAIACDPAPRAEGRPEERRTALFFTGGVDSFHSLLCPKEPIDGLVYVQGFDVGVDDLRRAEDTRQHLQQIADGTGHRLIIVRTNLRTHPLIRGMNWVQEHGGALASAAYTLPDVRRVLISSSYASPFQVPCGTHPETDAFWSNEQLTFVHQGAEAGRMDKLRGIAEHPLVQRHLRVCWKNYGRRDNCCRCEKCLRTMLMLDALGKLGPFEAFPLRHQLFRRACGVSTIARPIVPIYRELLLAHPRRLIRLAIRIMLLRSWLRSRKQAILRRFLPAD